MTTLVKSNSLCMQVDFEITSAVSSHNRSLDYSSGYSDFSDLSDGESTQDQETFTIAKMKHCGEQGKPPHH